MTLEIWQSECIKRLPEVVENEFEPWESPGMMWIDIRALFERAYKPPRNVDLIRRIYEFAAWCADQPTAEKSEADLFTTVGCHFYEHLSDSPEMFNDIPLYMTNSQVEELGAFFIYHSGNVGYRKILSLFSDSK